MTRNNACKLINSEIELVKCIVDYLGKDGFQVKLEAPNMGQSVDIVASRAGKHTLIEAKLKNWRRAIEQCKAHELVADYVCVALCAKSASADLLREIGKRKYGLILCDPDSGSCYWHTKPEKREGWAPERQRFRSELKGINYAC